MADRHFRKSNVIQIYNSKVLAETGCDGTFMDTRRRIASVGGRRQPAGVVAVVDGSSPHISSTTGFHPAIIPKSIDSSKMDSPRRNRNRAACRRCQRRKIKCDGVLPQCASCKKAKAACVNDGKQEVNRS